MPQEQGTEKIKVYIYGFEPWNDYKYNTSQDVVELLKQYDFGPNVEVRLGVLPVDYLHVEEVMQRDLKNFQPDYVIGMGRSASRTSPHIWTEQNAYAVPYYKLITDIAGHRPHEKKQAKILPAEQVADRLKNAANNQCTVQTDTNAGAYLCERSMCMGSFITGQYGKGTTFIHLAYPSDEKERQAFAKQYADMILELTQSLQQSPIEGRIIQFHQNLASMHGENIGSISCSLPMEGEPLSEQIVYNLECEVSCLKETYPIMKEKSFGANGTKTKTIVEYEQAIGEGLYHQLKLYDCADPATFMHYAQAAGLVLVHVDGHKNTFTRQGDNDQLSVAESDSDHGYFLSLHTGNVFDLNATEDSSIYFEQQSNVSPRRIMAGDTMIASNDGGKTLSTFGSYYGGDISISRSDYEQNLIGRRLKQIQEGNWHVLNFSLNDSEAKPTLLANATRYDHHFVTSHIAEQKQKEIAANATAQRQGPNLPNRPYLITPFSGHRIPITDELAGSVAQQNSNKNWFGAAAEQAKKLQSVLLPGNIIPEDDSPKAPITPQTPMQPGQGPHKR